MQYLLQQHLMKQIADDENTSKKDLSFVEHEITATDEQLASRELQLSDLERQLRQDNLQVFCTANNLSLLSTSDGKLRDTMVIRGFY